MWGSTQHIKVSYKFPSPFPYLISDIRKVKHMAFNDCEQSPMLERSEVASNGIVEAQFLELSQNQDSVP
jgi:hypothetical protein